MPKSFSLPDDPGWLLKNLGLPPRELPLLTSLRVILMKAFCPKKLADYALQEDFDAHFNGIATWGALIKANRHAYTPDAEGDRFFGVTLVAPQLPAEDAIVRLPPIAAWIESSRGLSPGEWSDEVKAFMDEVNDDVVRHVRLIPVPAAISKGLECSLVLTIFPRKRMPGRVLAMDVLPLLLVASESEGAALLPELKHWAPAYKQQWLQSAKKMERDRNGKTRGRTQEAEQPELFALEVTGLPPERMDGIEADVYKGCAALDLKCLFLNVGSLRDGHGTPVPCSGDLQFLGAEPQSVDVVHLLNHIFKKLLSDREMAQVHVTRCDLEEFFERFDEIIAEL